MKKEKTPINISFTIKGAIPSKKNTWKRGKYGQVYQAAQREIDSLILQVQSQKAKHSNLPLKNNCMMIVDIYGDNRNDLDNQITTLCDVMEDSGIVENDRLIKEIQARKIINKDDFWVYIAIEEI